MAKKGKKNHKVKSSVITIIIILVIAAAAIGVYYTGLVKFKGPVREDIAATVNGEEILREDLDKQYDLFFTLVGYPEEYKEQITQETYLNQMIVEELMLQEAEKAGISPLLIEDSELKGAIDTYLKSNGITSKQLAENLFAKELTIGELQDYFKKQIAINKFLNETMLDQMTVTDEEVKGFYEQNIESFTAQEGQIRARHILVETEDEAENILKQLNAGADFAKLAMEESLDTASGARGGELGFFTKEMMVKEFGDAAFELTVNRISKPVETQFGWHIIQRQSDDISLEDIEDALKVQLSQEKQKAALQTYIEQLKAKAEIETFDE